MSQKNSPKTNASGLLNAGPEERESLRVPARPSRNQAEYAATDKESIDALKTLAHGIFGRASEDTRRGMVVVKGKIKGFFKRVGVHLLAISAGGVITSRLAANAPSLEQGAMLMFFYLGAICLLPRRFDPRLNSFLFPAVSSLAQLGLSLLIGLPLPLAVFLAGLQTWVQRAIIRRFRLGLDWLVAPFLIGAFTIDALDYALPWGLMALATALGLGAYYGAGWLDARKMSRLKADELAAEEARNPLAPFSRSLAELEAKSIKLPAELRQHTQAIVLHAGNILACMAGDPADVQPGSRFLNRYLPATHKIVDEYIRLSLEGRGHDYIESVLGRVDELLARLAGAFYQEHGSLLRNDAMQLGVELQVLDKLLKMEGK